MMMNIANIHLENNTEIDQSTSTKKNGKKKKKESKKEAKKRLNEERRANKRKKKENNQVSNMYITQLEKIVSRNPEAIKPLLAVNKWEKYACGNTMVGLSLGNRGEGTSSMSSLFNEKLHQLVAKNLTTRGCTIVKNDCLKTVAENPSLYGPPNPTFSWGKEYDEILRRIDASMESLKLAGWPPVFVFLFDEPWLLIDRMFELVSPILGKGCLLESSMYGWALSRSKAAAVANNIDGVDEATTTNTTTINTTINNAQKKNVSSSTAEAEVGGNFPLPHRDNSFEEANFLDGSPSHLSTWMCVNDVGLTNGCMHILPKDADERFYMSNDYWHERVAYQTAGLNLNQKLPTRKIKPPSEQVILNFPLDKVMPMPAPRGSILLWQPNCIHWGSSCSSSSHLPPRKSLAMTFRCSASKRPISKFERNLMTRDEIHSLTIEDRLVMIVESILMYAKWFPSFKAFDLALLQPEKGE